MKEELKPCPFCGGKGEASEASFGPVDNPTVFAVFHDVTCEGCFAIVHGNSPEEAIKNWNTRLPDKGLAKALKELYALVQGECPSLLEYDSGGAYELDAEINKALREEV